MSNVLNSRRLTRSTKDLIRRLNSVPVGTATNILTTEDVDSNNAVVSRVIGRQYVRNAATLAIMNNTASAWTTRVIGDCVVCGAAGTPAGGGGAVAVGDIAEWNGTLWTVIKAAVAGIVPAGTRLLVSRGDLLSPMTDGTHENYIAEFNGITNTPTFTAPVDGLMVVVKGEDSLWENMQFVFDTTIGWRQPAGVTTSTANPTVNSDVVSGYVVGSQWLNSLTAELWTCTDNSAAAAKWKAHGYNYSVLYAAAAQRVVSSGTGQVNPFAVGYTFPTMTLPVGTRVNVKALFNVIVATGAETFGPMVMLDNAVVGQMTTLDVAVGGLGLSVDFVIASASTVHGLGGGGGAAGEAKAQAIPARVDTAWTPVAAPVISLSSVWVGAGANSSDLRQLSVSCISPNVG
jgi:hypothetical protein